MTMPRRFPLAPQSAAHCRMAAARARALRAITTTRRLKRYLGEMIARYEGQVVDFERAHADNIGTYSDRVRPFLKRISIAVIVLVSVGQAHAQDTKPVTSTQIALFATVCIQSAAHGVSCEEFQLTPGAAGPLFSSVHACDAGRKDAMERWLKDVKPRLGFTEKNVFTQRCGPPINPEREASLGHAWKAATAPASFAVFLFDAS